MGFNKSKLAALKCVKLPIKFQYHTPEYVSGFVSVHLKSKLGGESEDLLASSTRIPFRDLPTEITWIEFLLPEPASVENGQIYYLN